MRKLSALSVQRAKDAGRYCDGGGLYLQVGPNGNKSWLFRYCQDGRTRDMGLGALLDTSLAQARELAAEARQVTKRGLDPLKEKQRARDAKRLEAARAMNFADCAALHIASKRDSWRNAKHARQWERTLETYAFPVMGKLPVQEIDTALVLRVLEPIWKTKTETAGRVRERIEAVLDAAKARGFREGENPARWRGHLQNLLPQPSAIRKVQHHKALPYIEIGAFMADLRELQDGSARALEFVILTATRTSEALGAQWGEIDLDGGTWTIPANRIKAGKEHRVPLSVPVLKLLNSLYERRIDSNVFPGWKKGKPLSNMAMLKLLERMGRDITTHGFRSTFRDWAAEQTAFPREVAEMALAHAVESKVEAAYRRGDLFAKRMKLMAAWADYCSRPSRSADVLPMAQLSAARSQ
jgi:integrase